MSKQIAELKGLCKVKSLHLQRAEILKISHSHRTCTQSVSQQDIYLATKQCCVRVTSLSCAVYRGAYLPFHISFKQLLVPQGALF